MTDLIHALRLLGVPRGQEVAKLGLTKPTVTETTQATTTISGGVQATRGSGKFRYTAPDPMSGSWNSSFYVPGSSVSPDLAAMMRVEFDTDAQFVELYTLRYNTKVDVRVDGVLVYSISLDASGAGHMVKLDFGEDSAGVTKHIEFAGFNFPFGGVFTEATASVWYPSADLRPLLYAFGDSYTQGVGANGPDQVYARALADRLGMRVYQDGVGGSGWVSTGGNVPATRVGKRLAKMTETPDLIVSCFGYNDAGGNMTTLATNFNAWVAAVRALYPKTKIVVFGPWTPLGSTANLDAVESTIAGRCAALRLPFISIKNLVSGSNKARYTSGDNVHPTQVGHDFLGSRLADLLLVELTK